jgi:biopolymer transport protein ExbD
MKAQTSAHAIHTDAPHLGFQIAPMIDVVFVIMLFFMVMAGAIKTERILSAGLPREAGLADIPPYEIVIGISADGYISLNDEEIAADTDVQLKALDERLTDIKLESKLSGLPPIVILQSEETARYQRIVDVINVLSRVGITNVTFALGEEG